MSWLQQLSVFDKSSLKKCSTLVTTTGGLRYLEAQDAKGESARKILGKTEPPYVVDLKPDLQVGQIRPNLFIGSADVCADLQLLNRLEITHVLNVSTEPLIYYPENFIYKHVPMLDIPEENLLNKYEECYDFYTKVKCESGKLLVHCMAGISRAPAVAISFIMTDDNMPFDDAYNEVKLQRSKIKLNVGFEKQLRNWKMS